MGHMQAGEMAEYADLDTALRWHLESNHFPPLPVELVETAKRAITLANDDQWDELVELPAGITYRGETSVVVWAAVESMHLETFLGLNGG